VQIVCYRRLFDKGGNISDCSNVFGFSDFSDVFVVLKKEVILV
jgi:hypothetical protein